MTRRLFIVARDNPDLAGYLRERFESEVEVLLDRRQGERRRLEAGPVSDRRRADRRSRPEIDKEVRLTSYAFVLVP
jgi:hypothetical protein